MGVVGLGILVHTNGVDGTSTDVVKAPTSGPSDSRDCVVTRIEIVVFAN